MDTLKENTMNEFEHEIKVIVQIAENSGATTVRNEEGLIDSISFTSFDLLRFADFLVNSTMENYHEIKDAQTV